MARKRSLARWIALLLAGGCSDSHGGARRGDPTPEIDRSVCVTYWAHQSIGQALSLYENSPEGPRAPQELMRTSGGDRGWLVHTHADVTGDGVRDLVVRTWYPGSAAVCESIGVTVFEVSSQPAGSWLRESVASADCAGPYASLAGLGDWNADGLDDLAAQGFVFVRGASGALEEDAQRCRDGGLLGDLDGDGWRDSGCDVSGIDGAAADATLVVWGGPEAARTMLKVASHDGFAAAGDVNGDGFDDFIAHDYATGHGLVLGGADRTDLQVALHFAAPGPRPAEAVVTPGDVDADGFDDLVVSRGGESTLLRGGLDFPDAATSLTPIAGADRVTAAGDANCDGFADVLIEQRSGTALHLGSADGASSDPAWVAEITGLAPVFAPAP